MRPLQAQRRRRKERPVRTGSGLPLLLGGAPREEEEELPPMTKGEVSGARRLWWKPEE